MEMFKNSIWMPKYFREYYLTIKEACQNILDSDPEKQSVVNSAKRYASITMYIFD